MSERKGSIVIFSGARDRQGTLYDIHELFRMFPDLFDRSVVTGHAETHGLTYVRQKHMERQVATMPLDVCEELIERLDGILTEAERERDQANMQRAWFAAGYGDAKCADCEDALVLHVGEANGYAKDTPDCRAPKCADHECGCECSCTVFTFKPGEGPGPAVA